MSFISVFGFPSCTSIQSTPLHDRGANPRVELAIVLIWNIIGYIPVLGILAGSARLSGGIRNWSEKKWRPFNSAMIARGVLEIIGAGILLLILDIIVSIGRHLCSNASNTIASQNKHF